MANGTPFIYGRFLDHLVNERISFANDVFKGMIVTDQYLVNQGAHGFKSDITQEVVGSGYVAGGVQIPIGNIIYTPSTKLLQIEGGDIVLPSVTFSNAKYLIVYDDTPITAATKPLVMYSVFDTLQSPSDQSFFYNWPNGIMLEMTVPIAP